MDNFYELNADKYFTQTASVDASTFLQPLLKYLHREAKILDVGCGSGRDLLWFSKKGFDARGLERSGKLSELARQHSGCPVFEADFLTYDFSRHQEDLLLLIGSLCHLHHNQISGRLTNIIRALKKEGYLFISLKEGRGREKGEDGRVFYLWQPPQLETIFGNLNLKILEFSRQVSSVRDRDVWLGYLLQKETP